jgi:PEGA domain
MNAKFTCLLVVCALLFAGRAQADNASEARTRYERAVKLYEDGAYDAALAEFTRAYELNPSYKVLYNVGQVRVAVQDYAGALEAFQQYLREGGGKISESRSEAVRKELAKLEQRVARITVVTDINGAEVLVDDTLVGSAPLGSAVLVNSGARRVTVRHPEHLSQTQRVSLAGGENRKVTLLLTPRATAEPPPPPAPVAAPPPPALPPPTLEVAKAPAVESRTSDNRSLLLWSTWSTTGALALGTAVVGILALRADGDLSDLRGKPDNQAKLEDQSDKVDRLALTSDILLGASVVAAGVSLWLTLRPEKEQRTRVALNGRGLSLRTEF